MKRILWMTFLALALTLAACGSPATPTTPPPAPTEPAPSPSGSGFFSADAVIASAEVVPSQDANISFVISAPVKEVLVKEGDVVTAGQTLATLYSTDLELALTTAELGTKAAELEYSYWVPARYDRPPERRDQAAAELEQARRRLDTANASFAQTSLVAPFDATVVSVNIQVGEMAQAGRAVITLANLAELQIKTTDLSERDIPQVQVGQNVNVYVEALNLNTTGKVVRISPISETVGGDVVFPVTIQLDEQADGLLWGMTAEVEIQTK
jgi:multidrug efflux pump subunit AcrA (membrane-fusion protein)